MNVWMEIFASPFWHLILSMVMMPIIFFVSTTTLRSGEKRLLSGFLMYLWSQAIFLSMLYWMEPGYSFIEVVRDSYDGVAPPIVPIVVIAGVQTMSLYLCITSSPLPPLSPTPARS